MNLPKIVLSKENHRNQNVVALRFDKNWDLIKLVKTIPGVKWSQREKYWYIFEEDFNLNKTFTVLKSNAFLDYSALRQSSESKNKATVKARSTDRNKKVEIPMAYKNLLSQKRYAENTKLIYQSYFKDFIRHFEGRDLNEISKDEINAYILNLIETRNISPSQQNQRINAIKFYYEKVLGRHKEYYDIERPRKEDTLPDILSKQDVKKILNNTENIKHKTIIALIYSCGLRRSEVINLKINDIDSDRMMIKIRGAKGKKDRYVQLSEGMLSLLREYYTEHKPSNWLFEGNGDGQYSATSVFKVIKRSAFKAGIKMKVYPHLLRHSYATHQLEQGIDIRFIQEWMGHDSIRTTERYTHVSEQNFKNFKNPLDDLL